MLFDRLTHVRNMDNCVMRYHISNFAKKAQSCIIRHLCSSNLVTILRFLSATPRVYLPSMSAVRACGRNGNSFPTWKVYGCIL